jgi:hypothetical protein
MGEVGMMLRIALSGTWMQAGRISKCA